ncbi:MAG: hypothetical protein FWG12_07605 [Holophagaceae bacterium]|nr:hypothetical protein [Holophagaceae bacterium]
MTITSQQSLELLRKAQASGTDNLNKFFVQPGSQLQGLMAYDLAPVASVLYPVLTPLRNRIPRVAGGFNIQTNWKAVTGINTANQRAGVSEGNRSAFIAQTTADYFASYRGYGLENYVTFEGDYASKEFADVKALAVSQLLQAMMIQEERLDLGGNTSVKLGKTPTPALSLQATGGSIAASSPVSVICIALGPQAYLDVAGHNNGIIGQKFDPATAQVPGLISRTNADGTTDSFGGGSAQKSNAATLTTGAGAANSITAVVDPVKGAWGYAWFAGPAGSEKLCAVTSVNTASITSVLSEGQLASSIADSDNSTSHLDYDGLFMQAAHPNSNAYWKTMETGQALTSDGAGGIEEFEEAFMNFYNLCRISPTLMLVSSQECVNITKKIIANQGAPLLRFSMDAKSMADGKISAGVSIGSYLNKVMGVEVPIVVHPNLAPGTIFFISESIPYPLPGVAHPFQKRLRADYYQLEWPLKSRKYEYGVYADGVLQHFAPFSMGAIVNISNG